MKIFDFRFLVDLHILGCPEHDLTISGTNALNFMKFCIYCYPNINWCLSTFVENCSIGDTVVTLLIFGISLYRFLLGKIAQKFTCNICVIRNNNHAILAFIALQVTLQFPFSSNSWDSPTSYSSAWNRTKFCMQCTYLKRWHWYKFCKHSLTGVAVITILLEFGIMHTYVFTEWNHTKIYMQDMYY